MYDAAMVAQPMPSDQFRIFAAGASGWRRVLVALVAGWLAFSATAVRAQELGNGVLLVAGPTLADPNFANSVVLVLQHGDAGTIGVVLNRVTTLVPATVFPELAEGLGAYSGTLYRGGPVGPTRLVFLIRGLAAATVNGPEIVDKVFLSGDPEALGDITRLATGPDELRMFAGHAEWTAGQLEGEIRRGAWRVVAAAADTVFGDPSVLHDLLSTRGDEVVASTR
jgi:putative transcriptional regulator